MSVIIRPTIARRLVLQIRDTKPRPATLIMIYLVSPDSRQPGPFDVAFEE